MSEERIHPPHLDWLDPIKALALLGILLNHWVEEFGAGPWFTNPGNDWPGLATRLHSIFPQNTHFIVALVQFLGWLGDSGPGVFILLSGFGLAWSAVHSQKGAYDYGPFLKRRLGRLFPTYIAVHLVVLAGFLLLRSSTMTFASRRTLLSLLGLRFTDSLFFYMVPAWWFVWTILQLYALFPLLWRLINRVGRGNFIAITFGISFVSRSAGLFLSGGRYFWMTGMFCGTRLAEFAFGMLLAVYLFQENKRKASVPSHPRIGWISAAVYVVGFGCSLTLPGSIVSNLLVSVGLTGLFYVVWKTLLSRIRALSLCVSWLGAESYAIYLFHQAPLLWTSSLFSGRFKIHFMSSIAALIVSVPAAWAIDRVTKFALEFVRRRETLPWRRIINFAICSGVWASFVAVDDRLGDPWKFRVFAWTLGVCLVGLVLLEWQVGEEAHSLERWFRWSAIASAFTQLFVVQPQMGAMSLTAGIVFATLVAVARAYAPKSQRSWIYALLMMAVVVALLEFSLKNFSPLEAGSWGELPALQIDPTCTYSLKPNQVTRLRYNNYDYTVRTNSYGLNSPEISLNRPTPDTYRVLAIGDAFTMPEGLDYAESYPARLQALLSQRMAPREVQVINAGVTGYGPPEELPQLAELCPLFKPNVVVYQFFIDEFTQALLTRQDRLREIGLDESGVSKIQLALERSQIIAHFNLWQDRIIAQLTGRTSPWRYGKALLQYYALGEHSIYCTESLEKVRYDLDQMRHIARSEGADFIVVFVPGAIEVSRAEDIDYFPKGQDLKDRSKFDLNLPEHNLLRIASELGIEVVNLTPYLRNDPRQPVYFRNSWHWNAEGHRVAAQVMANVLLNPVEMASHQSIPGRALDEIAPRIGWQPEH
ncbi:MAG: acyltransferase family protein [Acidobacteriia bacterium]|nr:acyltransferase family protein [Terriglobia bacterium]